MTAWSETEAAILRALAFQVRILTAEQIARGWCAGNDELAKEALARLGLARLVSHRWVEAHQPVPMSRPLYRWQPGKLPPFDRDLVAVADKSCRRWNDRLLGAIVYFASPYASRLFGAFHDARHLKDCEVTHDLQLSEVFLHYANRTPRLASRWRGEGSFPKLGFAIRGMKDPDAFLVNQEGQIERIVELAGKYSTEHLRAFHNHCSGAAAQRLRAYAMRRPSCTLAKLYPLEGTGYELW